MRAIYNASMEWNFNKMMPLKPFHALGFATRILTVGFYFVFQKPLEL